MIKEITNSKYKVKFSKISVINISNRPGINSILQGMVYNLITNGKKKLAWEDLIKIYIDVKGDNYIPKFINVDNNSLIIGNPSKISYHYKHNTIEWHSNLKPKIRQKFINVFGQLVMNGMLKIQPIIKE